MSILSKRYYTKPNFFDEILIWQDIPRKKNNPFYLFNEKIAKKNYTFRKTDCLCLAKNDILISSIDRYRCEYKLVLCKSCGLIRAKNYWNDKYVEDFYKNYYYKIWGVEDRLIEDLYLEQSKNAKRIWEIIEINVNLKNIKKNFIIVDVGGGGGGSMDFYRNICKCILVDYDQRLLNDAEKKGITTFNGGVEQLSKNNIFPDIIILSHVIEHWANFENELKNLIKCLKKDSLVYIEVPGIDRFKKNYAHSDFLYDFLSDIHIPHFYYFSSSVLQNIFERNGFEKVYINPDIRAIFKYTGKKKQLLNFVEDTIRALKQREGKRRYIMIIRALKKFIKFILGIKR